MTPARCTNWPLKTVTIGLYSLYSTALKKDTTLCFVFQGESPCRLFRTASMFEWLRDILPTTHRGAVRKDGAELPARVIYVLRGSML